MTDYTIVYGSERYVYLGLEGGSVIGSHPETGALATFDYSAVRVVPTRILVESIVQKKGTSNTRDLGVHSRTLQLIDPGPQYDYYATIVERRIYT